MNKFQYLLLPLSFSARSICSACLVAGGPACALYFVLPRPARWMFDRSGLVVLSRGLPNACRDGAKAAACYAEVREPKLGRWAGGRACLDSPDPSPTAGVDTPRQYATHHRSTTARCKCSAVYHCWEPGS
ncbi:hypothetical protein PVAP13_3NG183114 [Panicum virgatum]|uniref:Uncharacterized protein n=1 Tax=Panicum virgatum TaxID=38727 RepID=A0A8T0UBD3_PANVG|nr:hypothetical protein PVAP13_3NG183114 [Panicum virgatum]